MLVVTAGLEVLKALLKIIANKLDNAEGSDIEAMEQVLESMKQAIELEKKVQEAQNAVDKEDVDLNDWIEDTE